MRRHFSFSFFAVSVKWFVRPTPTVVTAAGSSWGSKRAGVGVRVEFVPSFRSKQTINPSSARADPTSRHVLRHFIIIKSKAYSEYGSRSNEE